MTVEPKPSLPFLSTFPWKYTPGERTNCETITRSAPLMIKVPCSVINGKSPKNTSCDLISPVSLFVKRNVTCNGAE